MKQLNIQDAGFIYQETENTPMHICGLGIYDQGVNKRQRLSESETIQYIQQRIHHCPILSKKLLHTPGEWERPYWIEDPDFSVARHVFYHDLPAPGNEQQLHQMVSRLMSSQIDMTMPLWECHIIEGINDMDCVGKNSFAILTKVHHSCIDGNSANNVLTVLHDMETDGKPIAASAVAAPQSKVPGKYEMMAKAFATNIWTGWEQSVSVAKHFPAFARIAADLYQGKIDSGAKLSVPPTRFNKTPSTKRVFTSVDFNLDDIKIIKNAHGTTVNDVMVAIVAGGIRKYLLELGELPDESLGAMLPKNIRDQSNLNDKQGNRVGGLMTTIHTDIANPVERLKAVSESNTKAKAFSEMANTDILFPQMMGGFLYPRTGRALTQWAQKQGFMEKIGPLLFNMVITNVPGPNFRLYHAGATMQVFAGVPPLPDGIGLAHAIYSYCGRVNLSVLSCPLMLEDAEFYAQCLKDSFSELQNVNADIMPELMPLIKPVTTKTAETRTTTQRVKKSATSKAKPVVKENPKSKATPQAKRQPAPAAARPAEELKVIKLKSKMPTPKPVRKKSV
jgi:diacylglycerol O-acyltransferase / wax synthase